MTPLGIQSSRGEDHPFSKIIDLAGFIVLVFAF